MVQQQPGGVPNLQKVHFAMQPASLHINSWKSFHLISKPYYHDLDIYLPVGVCMGKVFYEDCGIILLWALWQMLGINREGCQPVGNTIGTAGHLSFRPSRLLIFIIKSNKSQGWNIWSTASIKDALAWNYFMLCHHGTVRSIRVVLCPLSNIWIFHVKEKSAWICEWGLNMTMMMMMMLKNYLRRVKRWRLLSIL